MSNATSKSQIELPRALPVIEMYQMSLSQLILEKRILVRSEVADLMKSKIADFFRKQPNPRVNFWFMKILKYCQTVKKGILLV